MRTLLLTLLLATQAHGVTVYMQDLGADFVPQAGNAQGDIVGYKLSTNQAAVRRANGTIQDLGTLGGSQSRATAISDDGSIIVGWAENAGGTQKAFRHEGSTMIQVTNLLGNNQAVGLNANNDVYFNRQSGSNSVNRWNRSTNTVTFLVDDAQTSGVNLDGTFVGRGTLGGNFYFDTSLHGVSPSGYDPSAGLSDSDLSAGVLSGSAAYYRLGDALALNIPNIFTLGATSFATGVNDFDKIVGDTDSTVFLYSLFDNTLVDLNAGDFEGANALLLNDIYGIGDNNVFFGKYTNLDNQERYFRGSLGDPPLTATLPGDYNANYQVDAADYTLWRDSLSSPNQLPYEGADGDGDGTIDNADYTVWQTNFGLGAISLAQARTLPLGSTVTLAATITSTTDLISSTASKNFYLQDGTAAGMVFASTSRIDTLLTNVNEGDTVLLTGVTASFNGVFQLVDPGGALALTKTSEGNPIFPTLVTPTDFANSSPTAESFENELVWLENVMFTQTGNFAGGANYTITKNGVTATVRISTAQQNLVGTPIPTGLVSLTGLFNQFDATNPLPNTPGAGYQLLLRSLSDIRTMGASSAAAVPEPSALRMLLLMFAFVAWPLQAERA